MQKSNPQHTLPQHALLKSLRWITLFTNELQKYVILIFRNYTFCNAVFCDYLFYLSGKPKIAKTIAKQAKTMPKQAKQQLIVRICLFFAKTMC